MDEVVKVKKKRIRRVLPSAREASLVLYKAIQTGEDLLNSPDEGTRLRAINALAAVVGAYLKGLELVDVQAEVKQLRKVIEARGVEA